MQEFGRKKAGGGSPPIWQVPNGKAPSSPKKAKPVAAPALTPEQEVGHLLRQMLNLPGEFDLNVLCCRLADTCVSLNTDPFADVAAFFYASCTPQPPPPDKPPNTPASSKLKADVPNHRRWIRMLKALIQKWGEKNSFLGFGQLWKVGLTDAEFERLCGLKHSNVDEVEKYGTLERMPLHRACRLLGLAADADELTDRAALQKRFTYRNVPALILVERDKDGRGVALPTVYCIQKVPSQIKNLKALKKKISGLELNEEPISTPNFQ